MYSVNHGIHAVLVSLVVAVAVIVVFVVGEAGGEGSVVAVALISEKDRHHTTIRRWRQVEHRAPCCCPSSFLRTCTNIHARTHVFM